MSQVTNAVLCLGLGDEESIDEVNAYFETTGRPNGFVSVDDPRCPRGWYGGTKFLEANLYVGAFNHLDLDELLSHLRAIEWSEPEAVQLLIQEQEDDRFRLINVMESSPTLLEVAASVLECLRHGEGNGPSMGERTRRLAAAIEKGN